MNKFVAIVPVYNPEPGLKNLVDGLICCFNRVVVVDDGSRENVESFAELPQGTVLLTHEVNCGKGRAMKTAMAWVQKNCPNAEGVVFADGDGQHRVEDIVATAERCRDSGNVVLGVRDFSSTGIPFRSRFGNMLTSFLARMFFRFKIYDTQTGLRAIPSRLLPMMLDVPGERYEYEMHLFGKLRHLRETLEQVPIQTIYLENNRASHFRPIVDSVKIYRGLFGGAFLHGVFNDLTLPFARLDVALISSLSLVGLMVAAGFVFNVQCQGWYFWLTSLMVGGLYARGSWRRWFVWVLVCALLILATAYMFAYTTSDAQRMHAVLQRFIISGWNPVYQCLPEDLHAIPCYFFGGVSFNHMLQLPKLTGYIGAAVAMATHLWIADAFVGNVWLILLVLSALRFCGIQWQLVGWRAYVFAAMTAAPTFFINVFVGQAVDYSVYAAIIVTLMCFADWCRTKDAGDALCVMMASALSVATKPIAVFPSLVIWLSMFTVAFRHRRWTYFWLVLASVFLMVVLMASPLFTSWLSPREFVGLTNDFTCNEDAQRMGYLARICYGWLSKDLAIAGCKWWYGVKEFAPVFEMNVSGRVQIFNLLICLSLVAIAFCGRKLTSLVYLILAVSCVALPLKYIGYPRYVPQVWLIPFLGFYIFAFENRFRRCRWLRTAVPLMALVYISPFCVRTVLQYARYATLERMRQESLSELRNHGGEFRIVNGNRYWFHYEFARIAGVNITTNQNAAPISVGEEDIIYYPGVHAVKDTVLPQLNGLSAIRNTNWGEYLKTMMKFPRPISGR